MKNLRFLIIAVMVLAMTITFSVFASATVYSGNCGDNVSYTLDTDTGVLNISGNGDMWDGNESIWKDYAAEINAVTVECGVTSIGDRAFEGCILLEVVEIADTVTSIGEGAFAGCEVLPAVTVPSGIKSLGEYAFFNCRSLSLVEISNSVTSIGKGAFYCCTSLVSITIPDSVTNIGEGAFWGCDSLDEFIVDEASEAFSSDEYGVLFDKDKTTLVCCPSTKTSYSIPSGVVIIGDYAFFDCGELSSVVIPNSVRRIGQKAFFNCSSLESVNIPSGVVNIGDYAFAECDMLAFVTIPNGVTDIGKWAFAKCTALKFVIIPSSVKSIGNYAFTECKSLTSAVILGRDIQLQYDIFSGCFNFTGFVLPDCMTEEYASKIYGDFNIIEDAVITMTIGSKVATVNEVEVINDVTPIIKNDRAMLPVRFVAETFGASVEWNEETKTATILGNGVTMAITIGKPVAIVNREVIVLDSPAFIENDRTYLPVRFVAEKLGATVEWNGMTSTATLIK